MGVLNKTKLIFASILFVAGTSIAQPGGQPPVGVGDPSSSGAGGYVNSSWKPSLRKDGAVDMMEHNNYLTPWQPIREADVLWKKRVWMEIVKLNADNLLKLFKVTAYFLYNGSTSLFQWQA